MAERLHADASYQWSDFDQKLVYKVREGSRLAVVSLEIYGHLRGQTTNPDKLYRDEIAHVIRSLGLTPPA
jgi:hypothetical protein